MSTEAKELRQYELLVEALQWLPAGTVVDFCDRDDFIEEVRRAGWRPRRECKDHKFIDSEECVYCHWEPGDGDLDAVEQACAVPAPAVVTPEPTGGGKTEPNDDLAPPWCVFSDKGRPVAIMAAGRPHDVVSDCSSWPEELVWRVVNAANGASRDYAVRMERITLNLLEIQRKTDEAKAAEAGKAQERYTWADLARWCAVHPKDRRIGCNQCVSMTNPWKVWAEWNDSTVEVGSGPTPEAAACDLADKLATRHTASALPL